MFSLRDFIMETLRGMKGNYPDFQIREYALNWYGKGKLTETDLEEIEELINPAVEETVEIEEITETEETTESEGQ